MALALDVDKWSASRPLYIQGKRPCYPLDRKMGGPQSQSGRDGEEKYEPKLSEFFQQLLL